MTTLLREVIEIPERVHRGDFVLRLAEGVTHPRETLGDYVVTEQLARCFDDALAFIRSAVEGRSSKAAYLHGSFGSGKSHFMAVLHLLLQHNADVRSVAELGPVIAKHSGWLEGKKFLLVPYHMIGAHSMEAAILGHYVDHVQRLHPGAPTPGVYLAERIFADAERLRQRMGDEAFFAGLNAGAAGSGGGWGTIGASWDAVRFEAALRAPARSEERTRLVGDLVTQFFAALQQVAAAGEEMFVPLEDGLSIISKHAQGLGYDAVILFLDELILWLASHVADMEFVSREGQKITKLVEAATPDRPVPLVSFVARQRDLRELVGDHVPGAQKLSFVDVLKYWEGRFHLITLEDRNLPAIAEKRLLRPRSEAARRMLDRAFDEMQRARAEVLRVLLTSEADQRMFRQVYPFSPALVQTLVAVSSVLQRERTALRVMLQLLVDQRDALALGDLIPVGDLFDVIAEGDEPFTEDMRVHFDNAKRLYHQKLRPLIEKEHGIRAEEVRQLPPDDPRATAFRADDRLIKTLLLAALVPEVEALKAMTGARLAALNHGTVRSPIPGREGAIVLGKCRAWAAQVGEIKISGDNGNPTIAIQVTGVDTEAIIEAARNTDNAGNRQRMVRKLLFAELGIPDRDELFVAHEVAWRGTKRPVDIIFGNIRELTDESLRAREPRWKVLIDFPFDPGRTPRDDVARLDNFRVRGESSRTVGWVPAFFTADTLTDLGTLVILDHVLQKPERFKSYAAHLSQVDQAAARSLLDNQRSQLQQRTITCLEAAYGVATPPPGTIDTSHEVSDRLQSLETGFEPRPPAGATLRAAFEQLVDQMLGYQYPAHPQFEVELRPAMLRRVYQEVQRATQAHDGRIVVEREQRPLLRQMANPLRLGEMHEDAFILGRHWCDHFLRKAAETGEAISVAKLRRWMDEPRPAGLPRDVQNLVILVFADQTNRSFFLHGGPAQGTIDNLADELELREQRLPASPEWEAAVGRAAKILGLTASPLASATSVAKLAADAKKAAAEHRTSCSALVTRLGEQMRRLGLEPNSSSRHRTAVAALGFLEAIHAAADDGVVTAIVRAEVATSAEAMGTSIRKAAAVVAVLGSARNDLLEAVAALVDDRKNAGAAILQRVREAIDKDELAVGLEGALRAAEADSAKLLSSATSQPPPVPSPGMRLVERSHARGLEPDNGAEVLDGLRRRLMERPGRRLSIEWSIEEPEDAG